MNLDKNELMKWRVQSPEEVGFHKVIIPSKSACKEAQMFRLNLKAGDSYDLVSEELELHAVLILGKAKLSDNEILNQEHGVVMVVGLVGHHINMKNIWKKYIVILICLNLNLVFM